MSGMKIIKKIEVATLNLKLLIDTLEQAEEQLKEGSEDLHFRLSYFRKRLIEKDKKKYDAFFFGPTKESNETNNIQIKVVEISLPSTSASSDSIDISSSTVWIITIIGVLAIVGLFTAFAPKKIRKV